MAQRETFLGQDLPMEVLFHVDSTKQFTTAALVTTIGGIQFAAFGTAKRNITDPYDEAVGTNLSLARALRDLSEALEQASIGG